MRQRALAWLVVASVALPLAFQGALTALAQTPKKRAAAPRFNDSDKEIFFTDARTTLVGERPAFSASALATKSTTGTAASTTNAAATTTIATPGSPAAGGAFAWSKLISPETLVDEIKRYQPLLADEVKSPSQFKGGGMKNARRYFSALAVTFAVAAEYDGEVRWKNQSPAARELFGRAGFNCKTATDQAYNESKLRNEDLGALLRGENIEPPANLDPNPKFNERVANRPPLMWRLERAQQDRIAPWTADEAAFKKQSNELTREAEIVAMLAEVIQRDSYADADGDSYKQYAKAMQQGALDVIEGVKSKNLGQAQKGASAMSKACSDCHGEFRS